MKFPQDSVQANFASPLGRMVLAAANGGLVGAWFADQAHVPDLNAWPAAQNYPLLQQAAEQLLEYFASQRQAFTLPLNLAGGTAFQQSVWLALLELPFGSSCAYGDLARRIGRPAAVRAVGAAVGRNPLSIIVPCHRVIGANGSLTGYAGGLQRKTSLLQLEGLL